MVDKLNVAILQLNLFWEEKKANINKAKLFFQQLPQQTDLWVLPEMFSTGFTNNVEAMSETMQGETIAVLKKWAAEKQLAICTSIIIKDKQQFFNRFIFVYPNGEIKHYDKAHLFSLAEEDEHYKPGSKRVIIDYKGWRIMPQVCYDLRFPVWSRNNLNYDLLIYVANWPGVRDHVWQTLLMARAIENMCYAIGANRIGTDGNGIAHNGNSAICDAKGNFLNELSDLECQIYASLEYEDLQQFRQKFPVLKDQDTFEILNK